MRVSWLADVLRAAGLPVVEHPGWKERGEGEFVEVEAVVWHHDASAVGYSPGMADYIRSQVDLHKPGANCWVTLDGTWHLIAAEVTYHAGTVLPGKAGNHRAIGIETDHTTGETWSGVFLLDSLRRGTAAILCQLGTTTGDNERPEDGTARDHHARPDRRRGRGRRNRACHRLEDRPGRARRYRRRRRRLGRFDPRPHIHERAATGRRGEPSSRAGAGRRRASEEVEVSDSGQSLVYVLLVVILIVLLVRLL